MTTRQEMNSLVQPHTAATGIATSVVMPAQALMPPPALRSGSRPHGRFLKGPIPWAWLAQAMPLPGKAMQVAIHVWRELELAKSNEVSISMTGMIGISRFAASRGLVRLEKAGLVSVVRRAGRKARVLVLSTRLTKEKLPDAATTVGTSQVITAPDVQGQG